MKQQIIVSIFFCTSLCMPLVAMDKKTLLSAQQEPTFFTHLSVTNKGNCTLRVQCGKTFIETPSGHTNFLPQYTKGAFKKDFKSLFADIEKMRQRYVHYPEIDKHVPVIDCSLKTLLLVMAKEKEVMSLRYEVQESKTFPSCTGPSSLRQPFKNDSFMLYQKLNTLSTRINTWRTIQELN